MWFADMATCIYNHFVIDGDVCSRLGLCKKASIFTPRDWTCEECTDILAKLLTTCPILPLLMKELHTFRETASVARMDTLTTALTPSAALFHLLCQFLPRSSLNRPLSFAKKLLVFAKLPI